MKKFQTPKGTRDILYEDAVIRRRVIDRLRETFLRYGYCDFFTPSFEYLETLQRKSGDEVEDQIYAFEDKGGRKLGLIFEFTTSLGRVAAANPHLLRPFKRYQIGNVWRYENPQSNRYREFCQADIDIIGPSSMDCEMEILVVVADVLRGFGVNDFTFILNNRKILLGQLERAGLSDDRSKGVVLRGLDKLDKIGPDGVKKYIVDNGVAEDYYNRFMELLPPDGSNDEVLRAYEQGIGETAIGREGLDELKELLELAATCDLAGHIRITPSLVRGLDYYTGTIFEVRSPGLGNTSFGGGGRYDKMVEMYGGQAAGAAGFAFGVERLVTLLAQQESLEVRKCEAIVMLALASDEQRAGAFELAGKLRAAGIPVFQFLGSAKLKKQFGFAGRMGFPYVITIGEDEIARQVYPLKDMHSGEETRLTPGELCTALSKAMQAGGN